MYGELREVEANLLATGLEISGSGMHVASSIDGAATPTGNPGRTAGTQGLVDNDTLPLADDPGLKAETRPDR